MEGGDLCALLRSSADRLDQLAEGARLTGDKRTWRGEAGRIRIFAHRLAKQLAGAS